MELNYEIFKEPIEMLDYQYILDKFSAFLYEYYDLEVSSKELLRYLYDPGLLIIFWIADEFEDENFFKSEISENFIDVIRRYSVQLEAFKSSKPDDEYRKSFYLLFVEFDDKLRKNKQPFVLKRKMQTILEKVQKIIYLRHTHWKNIQKENVSKISSISNLFGKNND